MIRAKSITIEEFRGIRSLTIDFKEKSFAVCGPNGTGKSGIVDALEFALTGSISRLSGKGTGSVSVKEHAPHVDSRNRPDKARVVLTVSIPHLGKEVTIERTVKDAATPTITSDTPDVHAALEQVAQHPEFVLSRRELIRYVISAPGDRAKEVQALLRLDAVEDMRATLFKISNAKQKEIAPLLRERNNARDQLLTALQITEFSKEKVLQAVNTRRAVLSLSALSDLTATTSVRDGLAATPATQATKVPKTQTIADLKKLRESIELTTGTGTAATASALITELEALNSNPEMLNSVSREQFLKSSLTLIDGEVCPLCDKPWDIDELKAVIQTKLKRFEETARKRTELEKRLAPLSVALEDLANGLAVVCRTGPLLTPPVAIEVVRNFKSATETRRKQLDSFLPLPSTIQALKDLQTVPVEVLAIIATVEAAVAAIPEA
ncbi:MAG: AAA family ATPase, partial [Patescibacteria group bacterium]|nr:AAA family ATPase [Patescibacteria group bacterium]